MSFHLAVTRTMKRPLLLLIMLQTVWLAQAQNGEKEKIITEDTTSLRYAFNHGKLSGHFRYFFMATDNTAGLSDYHAHAVGGGIKYETAPFKHIRLGISGFFVFNIGSSDLAKPDPKTSQFCRYEIGLFDIQDPNNKKNIDRLEELYLKYNWKNSYLIFGRQLLNTPFINLQDSRMRPTEVGGVYGEINELKHTKIEGGYIYQLSPRSTVNWYPVGESIGIYPQGVNADGKRSGYAGNLESKAILLLGISHKYGNHFTAKLYNQLVANIFNALLLQADYTWQPEHDNQCTVAVQCIREDAVNNGGNADQTKTYFPKGGKAQTFGVQLGWTHSRWQTSLNYNRITAAGRYLSPREWGRDPFFTYLPRERNEGLGDADAVTVKAGYSIPAARLNAQAGLGYYHLPEVTHFMLNKYGLPSYIQWNMDIRYTFSKLLKGLEAQCLFVYKGRKGNTYGNDKYVFNKVDLRLWNLVLNYRFGQE